MAEVIELPAPCPWTYCGQARKRVCNAFLLGLTYLFTLKRHDEKRQLIGIAGDDAS